MGINTDRMPFRDPIGTGWVVWGTHEQLQYFDTVHGVPSRGDDNRKSRRARDTERVRVLPSSGQYLKQRPKSRGA